MRLNNFATKIFLCRKPEVLINDLQLLQKSRLDRGYHYQLRNHNNDLLETSRSKLHFGDLTFSSFFTSFYNNYLLKTDFFKNNKFSFSNLNFAAIQFKKYLNNNLNSLFNLFTATNDKFNTKFNYFFFSK
jgi:hypothetical protein